MAAVFTMLPPGTWSQLRSMVLAGDPDFLKAQKFFVSSPCSIWRSATNGFRYAEQPESLRQWLERRNLCFVAESTDFELLFSDQLAQKLETDFVLCGRSIGFIKSCRRGTKRQTEQSLAQR